MHKIILVFYILVLDMFSNVIAPKWFIQNSNEHTIYSYGKTLKLAKIDAKKQIIKKLKLKNISINDFKITKQEIFENKYFLKIQYIDESILTQIKNEIKSISFKTDEQTNKYLINTIFAKDINNTFGYIPNMQLHDNKIYFNNKNFIIKNHEFNQFYAIFNDENISLNIKKNINNNENFFIQSQSSYKSYASLARVINGKFEILFKNKNINESLLFPNFKVSDGLKIQLNNQNKVELFTLLVLCDDKKDFSSYNMIFQEKKNALSFSSFINKIKNCKIESKISMVIK